MVSRTLKSVGANAVLVDRGVDAFVRALKSEIDGEIAVAGPELATSLAEPALIDEYRMYVRPIVLGSGKPYFATSPPPLRFVACDRIGADAVRLTYATIRP